MKEFVNRVLVIAATQIPATIVHPYSEYLEIHSNFDVAPNIQQKESNGNNYHEFNLRITHDGLSDSVKTLLQNERPVSILLFDDSGNHYQVGTLNIPIQAIINTPKFNNEVKFKGKLLELPY